MSTASDIMRRDDDFYLFSRRLTDGVVIEINVPMVGWRRARFFFTDGVPRALLLLNGQHVRLDVDLVEARWPEDVPSFTCPLCKRTSYNPNDVRDSYCAVCHQSFA